MRTITGEKHLLKKVETGSPVAVCSGDLGAGFSGSLFAAERGLINPARDPLCYWAHFADGSRERGRSGVVLSSGTHPILGASASFSEGFEPDQSVSCKDKKAKKEK